MIEPGNQKNDSEDRDRKGEEGKKDRFAEELPDEAHSPGTHDLPETDFPGAFGGPGCGQSRVIEAGNEEDEEDCR